ncbi:MAG: family N-acetyltransferase [Mucilaginibacter sp.]|uniref:GNAT family N-acetyltransferase n=1 Tax=Mucilaginibacter sp. TaxID=1882438 RepID=UPI00263364E0|nr:GNAT family N-acetyltransferase [Mucilaginibacter sp.]MDB5001926.1 family N-acetyltransferase [Mucilaginibacter sp.]
MYTIREATVNDAETIRALANEIWWPTYSSILADDQINFMLNDRYSTGVLAKQIQDKEQTYLLLIAEEQTVAFAAYSPDDKDPHIYKLHKLYMLPSTQGKGYGKILLNAVYEKVLAAGKNILELNVHRRNPAKTFYEKMGFTIAYEIDIPFGPYFLNDYVMRKEL